MGSLDGGNNGDVMRTETRIELADGTQLGAFVGGSGEAGTVILVPPFESTRHNPRNQRVAEVLQTSGYRTVLLDLLTDEEEGEEVASRERHFGAAFLADRLAMAAERIAERFDDVVGFFGADTGACVALQAAAEHPDVVGAVVARGCGRLDDASEHLHALETPTLFVAGAKDGGVAEASRRAAEATAGESAIELIEGASHFFEEGGALEEVARVASSWFDDHLGSD